MSNLLKKTTAKQESKIRNAIEHINAVKHKDELLHDEAEILEDLMRAQDLGQLSARKFISKLKQVNPVMYKEVKDVVNTNEYNQDYISIELCANQYPI